MGKTTTSPFGTRLTDDNLFNVQSNFVNAVVTNKTAWDIPNSTVDELVAERAAYEPLYLKSQDKNTRTRTDIAAHRLGRRQYEKKCRLFWNKWIEDNDEIPAEDKLLAGGRLKDIEPTPRGKIATIPIIGLKSLGGGDIEVRCRVRTDQTRFSMHRAADVIQCRYVLVPVGEVPPEGQADAKKTRVSKKARFIISLGDKNAGQRFYGFFHWANLTNPQNSGPWSPAQTVVIA